MAVQFLILGCVALYVSQAVASDITTFASTYNTHAIQHAVAYPLGGTKVTLPAAAATPAVVAAAIPATVTLPTTATIPATSTATASTSTSAMAAIPAASSKPSSSAGQSSNPATPVQLPFAASANVVFVSTPFGFYGPGKVNLPAASVTFNSPPPYTNGPVYAASSVYASPYGAAPANTPPYAVAPVNFASANTASNNPLAHTTFAAGAPIFFASVSSVPNFPLAHASSASTPNSDQAIFAAPSYIPW